MQKNFIKYLFVLWIFICIKSTNVFSYHYFIYLTNEKLICSYCEQEIKECWYACPEHDEKYIICKDCFDEEFNDQLEDIVSDIADHTEELKIIKKEFDLLKLILDHKTFDKICENAASVLINNDELKRRYPLCIPLYFQKNLKPSCPICLTEIDCYKQRYYCNNGHTIHVNCKDKMLKYKYKCCPICGQTFFLFQTEFDMSEKKDKLKYIVNEIIAHNNSTYI